MEGVRRMTLRVREIADSRRQESAPAAYDPSGGLSAATLGNGFAETRAYNSRTWLGSILVKNVSNTVYSLSGPATGALINYAGNGNVLNVIAEGKGVRSLLFLREEGVGCCYE